MEERQNDAVKRLRASLKECTVLRAETYRDFIECQQERNRLTEELKEREKELSRAHEYAVVLNKMLRRK